MSKNSALLSDASRIPLLSVKAGPNDEGWTLRVKEELRSLIACIAANKAEDAHWFLLQPSPDGKQWTGSCWHYYKNVKYDFAVEFAIPSAYPQCPPEIIIKRTIGLTSKQYTNGAICFDSHLAPLWHRNVPTYGIAHAMQLGLSTWLAVEVPELVEAGKLQCVDK
jgi:ufm1-conjugating enzyme 1